jgi:hypothetical protein
MPGNARRLARTPGRHRWKTECESRDWQRIGTHAKCKTKCMDTTLIGKEKGAAVVSFAILVTYLRRCNVVEHKQRLISCLRDC